MAKLFASLLLLYFIERLWGEQLGDHSLFILKGLKLSKFCGLGQTNHFSFMSVAVSLPDKPLVAILALEHFYCQMSPNMVFHITKLTILDLTVVAGEFLQAQTRLFVDVAALGVALIDSFL